MSRLPTVALLLCAVLFASAAAASDREGWRRVPLTDAAEREALGIVDPARAVFAWQGPAAAPRDAGIVPIGRDQASVLVMGSEFVGISASFVPGRTGFAEELFCPASSPEPRARARLPLPSDRRLRFLDVWGFDSSATRDLQVQLFEYCLPLGEASEGELTLAGSASSPGAPGYFSLRFSLPPVWPATAACSWFLQVDFAGCQAGDALRLSGARVLWDAP